MADKSLTPIDLPELSSAPASPASGFHRFYAKTDGKAYSKSSAGTEYDLTTGVSLTTTGTSGAATLVGTTLNIPVYQSALTNPVTGTGANTRIPFWTSVSEISSNTNFVWNNSIIGAGIGTSSVSTITTGWGGSTQETKLQIKGSISSKFTGLIISGGLSGSGGGCIQFTDFNNSPIADFGTASNSEIGFAARQNTANINFYTTPSGTSPVLRKRIFASGNISIGSNTTDNGQRLQVYGSTLLRGSGTTSATTALLVQNSTPTSNFTIRDDGGYAFRNGTVGLAQTGYTTFTNLTTDRTCDANATTVEELADILGTLIEDLKTKGIIAA